MADEFIIRKGFRTKADSDLTGSLDISGSVVITGSLDVTGNINTQASITGSDVQIDDWGSVSASLSTLQSTATSATLQDVTDNGNTTTNDIYVSSSKSYYMGANSYLRRELNSGGYESIQLNGSVRLNPNTSANANNGVVIGGNGYLLSANSSRNAQLNYGSVSGQLGVYRLNVYGNDSTFQHSVSITGSLDVTGGITGSDTQIDGWGSVSASLANISAQAVGVPTLAQVTTQGNSTTNSITVGGLTVNGSASATGGFTGSLSGAATTATSASYASTASYAQSTTLIQSLNAGWNYDGYIPFFASSQTDAQTLYTDASSLKFNPTSNTLTLTGSLVVTSGITANVTNADHADNVIVTGKNLEAGTIDKGTPLYFTGSGTSGNLIGIYVADADNPARMPAGGIAGEDITSGAEGLVLINGYIDGVDTSLFNAGDEVYVAGGGGYTRTAPTGSALVQKLGNVTKIHASNGAGVINGPATPRSVPNIASGYTWVGNGNSVATPTAVSSLSVASAVSASHALVADAVNTLNQDVTVNGNLTVYGTASFTSVTSSQLVLDDSFVSVNVFEPAERFGGLRVYDSGSLSHQATASLAWDSLHNHWVYQNASGSTYSGGMFLSGPRNTGSLGDEPGLTKWYVARSDGGDHLNDSQIYSSGSKTAITGSLFTTGKVTIGTVDNYGTDPDKFLAIVNNEVVYRTGAELLSDIGGQTSGTFVQNAGSGGQARYIMRYADSNSATTSSIYEETSGDLTIAADNITLGGITIGRASSTDTLVVGSGSLLNYTGNSSQTVYGDHALQDLTTGYANDAFGYKALFETTTGTYNTAFGQSAGRRNNGSQNVFFGQYSGPYYSTLTGGYNVFIGPNAGIQVSGSAQKNIAIGQATLYGLTSGESNIAVGRYSLPNVSTGIGNIAIGTETGNGITTGGHNVIIGNYVSGLTGTLNNNIIIADGQGNIKYRYADSNTTITGALTVTGTTPVVQEGVLVSGTTSLTVASISTSTYEGAFLDYVITSGSNKRAGTLTTVWTASDIEWKDVSTLDLGSTDGAEFAPAINGSNADIDLTVPTGTWTVKGHLRYM